MADRSRRDPDDPDAPDYDWLYGSRRGGAAGSTGSPGSTGPDGSDWSAPRDPEPTRMLPTVERPTDAPRSRAHGGSPYQAPPPTRPRAEHGGSGRPRSRRWLRLRWLKLLLVLWVVFLVAVPLIAWSRIDRVDATPGGDRPDSQPGTTYLLVGSDSREGLTREQQRAFGTGGGSGRRTDTIMLLHTGSGPNMLMSIPRDSLVDVPGHGTNKINSAFAFGGPQLLVQTIEQSTGIRIDDYIEIGFAGFVGVVDAVNGIEICPKTAMRDRRANLDIDKGCQDVDGKVALGYARSRHTSGLGDIGRAQHQREVVSAVGAKVASPWSVVNPVRYYRLAMAGSDSLRVGEDTRMIATMRFAWAMTRVDGKNGLTCGVPISDLAVHWDPDRSRRMFRLIREDRTDDIAPRLCRPSGLRG